MSNTQTHTHPKILTKKQTTPQNRILKISFSGAMVSMVGDYKRTRNTEKFNGVSDSKSEFSLKKLTEQRL